MEIPLQKEINTERLKTELHGKFPEYRIKSASLNKKAIRGVVNGMLQAVVGQKPKAEKIICTGDINMFDFRIFVPFVLLIILFVIEEIAFIIIMMVIKKKEYKKMEAKIGKHLVNHCVN